MNSTTLFTLAQLKDADGRPLLDGLRCGADDMILGKRVVVCEDMPAIGANAHPVGVAPLSNSDGYYWHDDALSCHATRAQNCTLFMGQYTRLK
jgi:HK97 family phage major capsid protein